jgi:hypothetical protein
MRHGAEREIRSIRESLQRRELVVSEEHGHSIASRIG